MADTIPGNTSTGSQLLTNGRDSVSSAIDSTGDTDWFRTTLQAGIGYQVWVEGVSSGMGTLGDPYVGVWNSLGVFLTGNDDSNGRDSLIYYAPTLSGTYYFSAEEWNNDATGTYVITIERDALDSTASAAAMASNSLITGRIGYGLDLSDWAPITLVAGTTYEFDLIGSSEDGASGLNLSDPWIALRNSAGTLLASDDNSGLGLNARLFYTPSLTGTYFIEAQESGQDASGTYKQIVNASPVSAALAIGGAANGSLDFTGDIDLFAVDLTAGTTYNFTLTGATLVDPFLELLNSSGATLASNDNSSGLNAFLSYTPGTSGAYYVAARESGNDATGTFSVAASLSDAIPGNTSTTYTLPFTGAPGYSGTIDYSGDADWFTVTLAAGKGYQIWLEGVDSDHGTLGDPLLRVYNSSGTLLATNDDYSLRDSYLYLAPGSTGTYYISAAALGNGTGSYVLSLESDALASSATAFSIPIDGTLNGRIGFGTDNSDWMAVSLQAGTVYQFDMVGSSADGAGLWTLGDPWLALRNPAGTLVVSDDDSGVGTNARIYYTPPATGTYYVVGEEYGANARGTYNLVVNASPVVGSLAIGNSALDSLNFAGDTDLFSVSLTAGSTYNISATGSTLTNPFLELVDSSGLVLAYNDDSSGLDPLINFTASASGTYFVAVRESGGNATGSYTVGIATSLAGDPFENNDTAGTATVLGTISGTRTEANLTVQANDADWYRFTLPGTGRTGDNATVTFTHSLGDVDIQLYDSSGTIMFGSSTGVGNSEQINLAGLGGGNYLLKVYGYLGASNPNYGLSIAVAPQVSSADRFEENDTAATPTVLGLVSGMRNEASLTVQANDADWYRFTLPGTGRTSDSITVNFAQSLGDVDIQLYDSAGATLLASSTGVGNSEQIGLGGLAAGNYLVRVYGYDGASNPDYSLSVAVAPQSVTSDRYEDNDTAGAATVLGTISGARTEANLTVQASDADWYRFTLPGTGRTGDNATVTFAHSLGDVDIQLYDSTGTIIFGSSTGVGNSEQISLAGLAAGTYLLKAYGYQGASNPSYGLSIAVAPQTSSADRFEENDTAGTATDLRTISGTVTQSNLTVQANDADWYRFTLAAAGRTGDAVTVNFTNTLGDVDLQLYNAAGTALLGSSTGFGASEQISLAGLAAGSYLVQVYGYNGASNPDYSLTVAAAPQGVAADRLEDNDTAGTATNLRTITGTVTEANLTMQANDADWYAFTLASAGRSGDAATVSFMHSQGDIDLQLYNSAGTTLIATSTSTGNQEQISLAGLDTGSYLLKVYGYSGASNPAYSLTLAATQATALTADSWEANNTSGTATVIRDPSQTLTGATITAGDQDWFHFTLPQAGAASDRIALHTAGTGLQLQVLDAQLGVVSQAASDAGGLASLSLGGVAAGEYFVKVVGQTASTQAQYNLEVRAAGVTPPAAAATGWTVLVFLNGDNNLERAAVEDVNEMEAALNRSGVNVGILFDRSTQSNAGNGYDSTNGDWTDTRRGVIVHDTSATTIGSTLTSVGEVDMGSGTQLTNFLNWGAQNLPAEHYMVIIWDHGGGALSGTMSDDATPGTSLSNVEVATAIAGSQLGHVDIVGFDACLMGGLETASELDEVATLLIAAERTEPGDGWDYTALLNYLQGTSTATGLASTIVDNYGTFYGQNKPLSAITLEQTAGIEAAINSFVTLMLAGSSADWQAVQTARTRAATADGGLTHYVDLESFMLEVMAASSNAALDNSAQAVIDALHAAVLRKSGPSELYGLTIEFPARGSTIDSRYTASNFDFLADTTWNSFLQSFVTRSIDRGFATSLPPDFAESLTRSGLSSGLGNDTIDTPFALGAVNSADFTVAGLNIDSTGDADWFSFALPAGAGYQPSVTVTLATPIAGVRAQLMDSSGVQVAELTSTGAGTTLTFNQVTAGQSYFLGLSASAATEPPSYALHLDAFGLATAVALADFAETEGGNNSLAKAWQLGDADQMAALGDLLNLSLDATDLASGAAGGDWFRFDSGRVTEANVNHIEVVNVLGSSANFTIKVYSLEGDLIAQSGQPGDLSVTFPAQVQDVLVQVQAAQAQPVLSYGLRVLNDPPAAGQSVNGGAGVDSLAGGAGDDVVNGFAGNDTLAGGGGNDVIDAGADTDTVNFTGNRGQYHLAKSGGTITVADGSAGRDGTDTVTNSEIIRFADRSVDLTAGSHALIIDAASLKTLEELYVGFFNRIPESSGLSYWIDQIHGGLTLAGVANQFYAAGVQFGVYSANMTNQQFIEAVYANVLYRPPGGDHPPTVDDIAYWTKYFTDPAHPEQTKGTMVLQMLHDVHTQFETDPVYGFVAASLNNKAAVSNYYAVQQGLSMNVQQDNVSFGMQLAALITPTDTSAAIALIGVNDFSTL